MWANLAAFRACAGTVLRCAPAGVRNVAKLARTRHVLVQ